MYFFAFLSGILAAFIFYACDKNEDLGTKFWYCVFGILLTALTIWFINTGMKTENNINNEYNNIEYEYIENI